MKIGFDASRINVSGKTGVEVYSAKLLHWLKKIDASTYIDGGEDHNQYLLYTPGAKDVEFIDLPYNFIIKEIPFPRIWTICLAGGPIDK